MRWYSTMNICCLSVSSACISSKTFRLSVVCGVRRLLLALTNAFTASLFLTISSNRDKCAFLSSRCVSSVRSSTTSGVLRSVCVRGFMLEGRSIEPQVRILCPSSMMRPEGRSTPAEFAPAAVTQVTLSPEATPARTGRAFVYSFIEQLKPEATYAE